MFKLISLTTLAANTSKPASFARDARYDEMGRIDRFMTRICTFLRLI